MSRPYSSCPLNSFLFFTLAKPACGRQDAVPCLYYFRRPLRLLYFARPILFSSRKDAETQRNCGRSVKLPEALASSLLCVPNTFFFSQRPACGRQLQRNCARSVFLPEAFAAWRLCSLPRRIAGSQILFLFFTRAEAQRRKGIVLARSFFRRPLRLCGFARLIFSFFILAKPSFGRQTCF